MLNKILGKGVVCYSADALTLYIEMKCQNREVRGLRNVDRPIEYLHDFCGEKPIRDYKKSGANKLRDALYDKDLRSSSIKQIVG